MSLLQALDEVLTFTSDLLPDYIFANPGRKWVKRAVKSNDASMPQGKTVAACSAERKRQLTMCMHTPPLGNSHTGLAGRASCRTASGN